MKTLTQSMLLGTAMFMLAGCSTVSVQTDYDHTAKFGDYHTYTLAPASQGLTLSPTGEAALRDALRSNLALRGITEATESQQADLEIVRHLFTRNQTTVQQYSNWGYRNGGHWPDRYGGYGMWRGAPLTYTDVRQYTEGTLVLDFVDAKTHQLVLRGIGKGAVGSPQANAESIQEAVTKMVHEFPGASVP